MAKQQDTLSLIAIQLARVFRPIEDRLSSGQVLTLMAELGIQFPPELENQSGFTTALQNVATSASQLPTLVEDLVKAIEAEDYGLIADKAIALAGIIKTIVQSLDTIASALKSISPAILGITAAERDAFAAELAVRLVDYLCICYLESVVPALAACLEFFGVVERTQENVGSTNPVKPAYTKRTLHLDNIIEFVKSPANLAKKLYKWGDPAFDGEPMLEKLGKVFLELGVPVIHDTASSPHKLDMGLAELSPKTDIDPKGLMLLLKAAVRGDISYTFKQDDWSLELGIGAGFAGNTGFVVQPNGNLIVQPPSVSVEGKMFLKWIVQSADPNQPYPILGQPGGSRVEVKQISAGAEGDLTWNSSSGKAEGEIKVEGEIKEGKIIISTAGSDGFLAKILPGDGFQLDFGIILGVSSKTGFYFRGSSALEIRIPTHFSLGPLEFQALTLGVGASSEGIPVKLGATIKVALGPLTAVVENMGVKATFSFPSSGGNLGPLRFDLGFKPPNGVGLSVDSGVVKGGGFLYLDFDKGEYMGALELDVQKMFSLKAVGIINTKMPDGSDGFSLLIIITAEFSPIQLGFGFTLIGVGGLLGLNRTTRIEVLREGIKTNALKSILFPEDVVANISRIVSDIKQVFPPQVDRFIIGPMAKIGWGASIITLELGLLLEIPVPRIAILGVLKALLPEEKSPVLKMQINFLGVLDFENKYISFDASLYDSRLLVYTLTGDMAFRLSWGDNPLFILSVGGFHPSFKDAPADLQNMTRLTISLLSGNNPRICVQCYFAVTSNTVQFGAKAELYAEAAGFNVYGFVGFDVLFQFDPFHFIAAMYAGLALRRGASVLMGIKLTGELAGPSPWDVRGEASFSILFFDITVSFHETWGDRAEITEPEKVDVLALLTAEVNDIRNWKADIPDNNNLHVSVKKMEPSSGVPQKIEIVRFEINILSKLEETDRQYISGHYTKNAGENCYDLVEPVADADKTKIIDLLSSVQYYNLIIHPFGVLTFSERLVPLGISIDKFGNKAPQDANKFELTEIKSNATSLSTQEVKEQFARANFINMSDNEKLSHASFDLTLSGFKITASAALQSARPVSKSVDYELTYVRKKRLTLSFAGIYKLSKGLFKAAAKGSAAAKSSLSYQNNRISKNAPEAVAVMPEQYVIANISDMQLHSPELIAGSYTDAAELYRELVSRKPELKDQVQILSHYEMSRS